MHFSVAPRLTDIVLAVHEAGKAFFETALGKVVTTYLPTGGGLAHFRLEQKMF